MDIEKKENIGCLISTIIAFVLVSIGFFYFTKQFTAISAVICMFVIPSLPFYCLYQKRQYTKRNKFEYEILNSIQEYAEMLKDLSDDIENYNPEEDEYSPSEYLEYLKDEIISISEYLESLEKEIEYYY